MCCWLKGELVTQLIFLSKTIFCNSIKFPMTKKLLKIKYISCTLSLKNFKSPSVNPTTYTKPIAIYDVHLSLVIRSGWNQVCFPNRNQINTLRDFGP